MKKTIGAIALCSVLSIPTAMRASEESPADFFRKDIHYWSKGERAPETPDRAWTGTLSQMPAREVNTASTGHVPDKVRATVSRELGAQWVPTALALARLESGFNCRALGPKTRHGRARGVFQVMPGSARALGYDYNRLHECDYGIAAGVAHMKLCISSGVRTHAQMAKCHVAGVGGWNTRLSRNAERYKAKYVRMASRS